MAVFRDIASLRHWRQGLRGSLAFVPTMGNLHDGHLSLLRLAQARADQVLVSIYINPLQFGAGEDFSRYPRTVDRDLQRLHDAGCHTIFLPDDQVMYPQGAEQLSLVLPPCGLTQVLCGAHRTGHFTGVATVVLKLLHMVEPQLLILGEKDYQQFRIIQQVCADLNLNLQILAGPTQRASDGLALSSRNGRLNPQLRAQAAQLPATLQTLCALPLGQAVTEVAQTLLTEMHNAGWAMDYLELRDPQDLALLPIQTQGARWFAAGRLGDVRLIDNQVVPG